MIDTAFVVCFLIAFLVLSMRGIVHAFRKKPKGQGKPAALPDSWSRWILEEKKPKD
jgi:cbb3-type cytochrome oxidase subunit 3